MEENLIKEKFCQRKLLTRGSFRLVYVEIEHTTNLLSLWNEAFLTDIKIDKKHSNLPL